MSDLPTIAIKRGREKKIASHYPWVQREEVLRAGECEPGGLATLIDADGAFLATGLYNGKSRFPFRVLSLDSAEAIDEAFFVRRFQDAKHARERQGLSSAGGVRWLFSEADRVSGLIADAYAGALVVQVRNAGMDRLRDAWLPAMVEVFGPKVVYERSEMEGRTEEGLSPTSGVLYGAFGEAIEIEENGIRYDVPVETGLKTGFYLDQRETRRRLGELVRPGDDVLDAFCYMGAFSMVAASKGANCLGVDISEAAIEAARRNVVCNQGRLTGSTKFRLVNAFEWLEESDAQYDWIILDPPAIAKAADKRDSLKWAVWKLVHRAIPRLKPGGRIIVCSCSYQLSLQTLLDTIRLAASDRGKRALLDEVTVQAPDHPISLAFPESWYLKCAWVRFE